jgi:hypothetical protein
MAVELNRILAQAVNRRIMELIDENFQRLAGVIEKVDDLENQVAQIWTGAFYSGESSQPYTGAGSTGAGERWFREIALGNTSEDYTNWQPFATCDGYDIWKYDPSNYSHDARNNLYLDDRPLELRGLATADALTEFDSVQTYDGSDFTDVSTEAASRYGAAFDMLTSTSDYVYIGDATTFGAVTFYMRQFGIGLSIAAEYWNGAWTSLTLTDDTRNLAGDGKVSWDVPSDWATTAVNGTTKYWVRFSTSAVSADTPQGYAIVPADSVLALLYVTERDRSRGDMPWCSFESSVYVSIKSLGNADYEGTSFIRSGSSAATLRNYFVTKHKYKLSYEDSRWTGGGLTLAQRLTNGGL